MLGKMNAYIFYCENPFSLGPKTYCNGIFVKLCSEKQHKNGRYDAINLQTLHNMNGFHILWSQLTMLISMPKVLITKT